MLKKKEETDSFLLSLEITLAYFFYVRVFIAFGVF